MEVGKTMWVKVERVRLFPDEKDSNLKTLVAGILGVEERIIRSIKIIKKSLDARRHRKPVWVHTVEVELPDGVSLGKEAVPMPPWEGIAPAILPLRRKIRPVIIGTGPAGLFAALTFARHNIPAVILERGREVKERVKDVANFWEKGLLDTESNVQFGEGGAGTFSDGKLVSRTKDPLAHWVKEIFVQMGAPERILVDGKPHVGTDLLRQVVVNFRHHLIKQGCTVRFGAKLTDLVLHRDKVVGCIVNDGEQIECDLIVLAMGQSAEDTYIMLSKRGVMLAPKAFALGFRVEHPQEVINRMQYGKWWGRLELPPADYFLSTRVSGGRSVYSFCMCPGGQVIGASNHPSRIVTNGMSFSGRDGLYANSALVVPVRVSDFEEGSPLDGILYRRKWEEKAFREAKGGYFAPAEGIFSFMKGKTSPEVGETTFLPGVRAVSLAKLLPPFAVTALREGLCVFRQKIPIFLSREANLIGVETRTSAPVRILRGEDGQSVSIKGLYPCGEGAGYAGGIISSALDGIRAATRALRMVDDPIP